MPGDGPALVGMPDREILHILRIICGVVGGQSADRKLNSQTIEPSSTPNCKPNLDIAIPINLYHWLDPTKE